jgi:hypothetical protein
LLFMVCVASGVARPRAALAQRITEIQIAPAYLRMRQDAVARISATAYGADGRPIDVPFRWQSSNINVVVVDSLGNVRALAPGGAIVTASTDDAGRRRRGQVTVQVMSEYPGRPPGGPGFSPPGMGTPRMPPPGAPGKPDAMTPGAAAPGMPHEPPRPWAIDSAVRASINCGDPMLNSVNPMRACWDDRATLRDFVQVPDRPGADQCPQGVSGVGLLLEVDDSGAVANVRTYAESSCPEFTNRVVAMARALHFTPARRRGVPVRGWVRLQLRASPK